MKRTLPDATITLSPDEVMAVCGSVGTRRLHG